MAEETLRDQIARLELQIEQLADGAETCRKIGLFARAIIVAGAALMLAVITGVFGFNPTAAIGATAAIIGGVVLLGANASTSRQTVADMRAAETLRSELIGRIELQAVVDPSSSAGWASVRVAIGGEGR